MKIAFVVQRYGLEISGGAELHCRWIAEHMKKYCDVEVLTTRAFDYITWKNHYPRGEDIINGIPVKRFSVKRARNPRKFGRIQDYILKNEHFKKDELKWLEEEGPFSPALLKYIKRHEDDYDYFIFYCCRYYHSYWGINTVPNKSILVPTAEHDPVIHLKIFKDLLKKPRAIIYLTEEEKKMINSLSQNQNILGDVVGVGIEAPSNFYAREFLQRHGIKGDYIIYIGRIDENKGCDKLFDYFLKFKREKTSDISLALVGSTVLKIPSHPDIFHLGFISEKEKFSVLDSALFLVMPSFYESLSIVTLEAWALGKPVLANARCDVLKGQCLRSNAGLYYENYEEFKSALEILLSSSRLRKTMGDNGRQYLNKNYTWEIVENKFLSILNRLEQEK